MHARFASILLSKPKHIYAVSERDLAAPKLLVQGKVNAPAIPNAAAGNPYNPLSCPNTIGFEEVIRITGAKPSGERLVSSLSIPKTNGEKKERDISCTSSIVLGKKR